MYSMTGYGKGTYKNENAEVSCEIRTVNHRYLDLSLKMPRQFFAYEAELKELVKEKITRGHAEIGVVYK
ncbi:MAG: YicC/YloC family endoribonuclease, partial [Lachnospiraceae bacterium]